jgi:hypothetical protein
MDEKGDKRRAGYVGKPNATVEEERKSEREGDGGDSDKKDGGRYEKIERPSVQVRMID